MTEIDTSKPLSEATEGMMAMKYESDDLEGEKIVNTDCYITYNNLYRYQYF